QELFITGGCDDLILLTGEGVRRLLTAAENESQGLRDRFVAALGKARKITRGPKPANALRKLGMKPDITAVTPTTQGVIDTLANEDIQGRHIGVQLYGSDPNRLLVDFLRQRGAQVHTVAPYIYSDDADEKQVGDLINSI